MRRRLPLPQPRKVPKCIHGTYTFYMYVLLTRPTALSDFVLYYMFYVYIFSCLFLGPTYVRPIHVRITYTFYLYFAWLCLYMYVLRIHFTCTLPGFAYTCTYYVYVLPIRFPLIQLVYAPILYVLRIRTTYAFYLYSICTFLPICFTYPPYTYTYYLYVILIHITYTLYLYI